MRQVAHIMGMPITIDIPAADGQQAFENAFQRLREIDERYSTYKKDSEVSRFGRDELKDSELSAELKKVIKACRKWEAETGGYFSAWAGGAFDPSGYVKGWAIAEAGKFIEENGYKTYCISAAGDILARSEGEKIWNIGIQNPASPDKILNKLSISNGAVATSGNYERGLHIINPKTGRPADRLLSVSISGPDIITADVLATAVFAMEKNVEGLMARYPDYQALIIRRSRGNSP